MNLGIYIVLALMAITLVCAIAAPIIFATAVRNSRRDCIARYLGGAAYALMGVLGLITSPYLPTHRAMYTTDAVALLIILVGALMLATGDKIRQSLKEKNKTGR